MEALRFLRAEVGLAELGHSGAIDTAAQLLREQLRSVTDPERRNAEAEETRVSLRSTFRIDGGRPATEDERVRVERAHLLGRERVRNELRVDAALAHATRDQLGVLPAEVDDEHGTFFGPGLGEERQDLRLSA